MNHTNKTNTRSFWKSVCLTAGMLAVLAMIGCSPTVATPPIPKGDAMIHVEFKGFTNDDVSGLTEFVRKLAASHSALIKGSATERAVGDYNAFHDFWNNGIVDQVYTPNHPIPSPEVEASMKAELETYLRDKGIKVGDVKLKLRYGP